MNKFIATRLAGHDVLVENTPGDRQVILDATGWDHYKLQTQEDQAGAAFDEAVEAFFAPLTEAAAKLEEADRPEFDPAFYLVVNEPEEGKASKQGTVVALDEGSAIVKMIEEGNTDRLRWVGTDRIVITAYVPEPTVEEETVTIMDEIIASVDSQTDEV